MTSSLHITDEEQYQSDKYSTYGIKPEDRDIDEYIRKGFIILDKPAGPTSHDVVATVKKILGLEKAGHSGTLDPNVTGVLPIGLQEGTKVLSGLIGSNKRYICNLIFKNTIQQNNLEDILSNFRGDIFQVPPLKSNVVRKLRKRRIISLEVLDTDHPEILLDINCEAGTYIRTLCVDIGKASGKGGYMKELRRIVSGPFIEDEAVTLHDLFDAYADYRDGYGIDKVKKVIHPLEYGVSHLPRIIVNDNAVDPVTHGSKLAIPGVVAYSNFNKHDQVSLFTAKGELICLGTALQNSSEISSRDRGYIAKPDRVILERDVYPKYSS